MKQADYKLWLYSSIWLIVTHRYTPLFYIQELLAANQESPIDKNQGPPLEANQQENYKKIQQILLRLTNLCYQESGSNVNKKKHEQRLLRWATSIKKPQWVRLLYKSMNIPGNFELPTI